MPVINNYAPNQIPKLSDLLRVSLSPHASCLCVQIILDHASKDPDLQRKLWRERDSNDNTPHHIAARCNNIALLEVCITIVSNELDSFDMANNLPFTLSTQQKIVFILSDIFKKDPNLPIATYMGWGNFLIKGLTHTM